MLWTVQATVPLSSSPVRIPGFHPGDPGSNPGNGNLFAPPTFNYFSPSLSRFFSFTFTLHRFLHLTLSDYCKKKLYPIIFASPFHVFFSIRLYPAPIFFIYLYPAQRWRVSKHFFPKKKFVNIFSLHLFELGPI